MWPITALNGRGALESSMTMPPPARNLRHASPAASKARAPLCITPQMSTIQASKLGASSEIEDRMGMAAGVMPPHLEQFRAERKGVWRGPPRAYRAGIVTTASSYRPEPILPGSNSSCLAIQANDCS